METSSQIRKECHAVVEKLQKLNSTGQLTKKTFMTTKLLWNQQIDVVYILIMH